MLTVTCNCRSLLSCIGAKYSKWRNCSNLNIVNVYIFKTTHCNQQFSVGVLFNSWSLTRFVKVVYIYIYIIVNTYLNVRVFSCSKLRNDLPPKTKLQGQKIIYFVIFNKQNFYLFSGLDTNMKFETLISFFGVVSFRIG